MKYGIKERDNVGVGWCEANHGWDSCESGMSGDSNATLYWLVIMPEMFVIKCNSMLARDQAGDVVCI